MAQRAKRKHNKGAALLSAYLVDQSMTVTDFAAAVDSTKSYISMLKLGRVTPGLELATRIERIASIPPRAWLEAAKA